MKIFGIFLWLCGMFCLASGLYYLIAHGGFMHCLAGIISSVGTVFMIFISFTRSGLC